MQIRHKETGEVIEVMEGTLFAATAWELVKTDEKAETPENPEKDEEIDEVPENDQKDEEKPQNPKNGVKTDEKAETPEK